MLLLPREDEPEFRRCHIGAAPRTPCTRSALLPCSARSRHGGGRHDDTAGEEGANPAGFPEPLGAGWLDV